ncbi:MAG: hypothetical protein J7619_31260 [Dyadobacter sp.]|uniref:hypothetical protein n=1 Tax=Dyadobacter sp. TaxID=1914288 RepID=UPI001B07A1C9|nr:hypothetical protein [Dyadobacter sp.]MBO9617206.1 hypothetical protein [Dyadobacter sp.]
MKAIISYMAFFGQSLPNPKSFKPVIPPIPFSAAENVAWKGMSFSTNVGSISSLNESLKSLSDQLGQLNAWSFSSAGWDTSWSGTDAYRQRNIRKQYLGIIEEIRNMF